jgi:glycosyltransferase involved in cell wall biosynthesis
MQDSKVLRILFVFDNLELSGADKVAVNLIRGSAQEPAHGVVASGFVCMMDKTGGACANDPVDICNPGLAAATPIWKKILPGMRAILRCAKAARTADIVVGVTPPAAFVACCAGWLGGRPAAAWVHYDIEGWQRELKAYSRSRAAKFLEVLFYGWIVPRFANLVFVSEACRASMARATGGTGRQWTVIPNLFDAAGFSTQSPDIGELEKLKAEGVPLLSFVGRLSRQKRWEDAIRLMEVLSAHNQPAHLAVIGDGVDRQAFLDRVATSPASENIHWMGQLGNPLPALALADALILPSLYEAWPVVILEAFQLKVPVVSYACPSGPAEMLADGRGICCEETPEAMADAVAKLLSMSHAERTTMLAAAGNYLARHRAETVMPMWKAYAVKLVDHS